MASRPPSCDPHAFPSWARGRTTSCCWVVRLRRGLADRRGAERRPDQRLHLRAESELEWTSQATLPLLRIHSRPTAAASAGVTDSFRPCDTSGSLAERRPSAQERTEMVTMDSP